MILCCGNVLLNRVANYRKNIQELSWWFWITQEAVNIMNFDSGPRVMYSYNFMWYKLLSSFSSSLCVPASIHIGVPFLFNLQPCMCLLHTMVWWGPLPFWTKSGWTLPPPPPASVLVAGMHLPPPPPLPTPHPPPPLLQCTGMAIRHLNTM